jgi:hypothetical protein
VTTIVLQKSKEFEIPGCSPFIIKREDVTNKTAWYRLTEENYCHLGASDFYDYDVFERYYLVTAGLLDYCLALICGEEGGGKSLVMSWLVHEIARLFGKRNVLDFTPPHPELFGDYYSFDDTEFVTKIQDQMNILEKVEREAKLQGKRLPKEAYKSLIIYNSNFGLDEGDSYVDKSNRTNLSKFIGRVIRRRRHFHTNMFIVFVDPHDADYRLVANRATHEIACAKDATRPGFGTKQGWCVYTIECVKGARKGIKKTLHLKPADCTHLWDSYNVVKISHDQDVNLGGRHNKRTEEEIENN